MKKTIGTILAVAGFIGFFCVAQTANLQILVTGAAIALFLAGAYLLDAFNENKTTNTTSL